MKTLSQILVLTCGVSLVMLPASLRAAAFTQAEITQIFHEVKTLEPSGARPARLSETIRGQQSVRTGVQSRAELMFNDKSLTRLGAETIFSFQQDSRELELKQGTILFQVPKGAGGAKIRTAAITAAVTGTTGFYEYSPKAGPSGIIKFGILEGEATLFIKGKLGHFIRVGPGEMVIVSARPRDFNNTDTVHFDIKRFMATAPLVAKMGGLPNVALGLIGREVAAQTRKFTATKELFRTNMMIPGNGTEVFVISQLDQRLTAANPLTQQAANPNQPQTSSGSPPPNLATSPLYAGLPTITAPNPYVVKGTTQVHTDPVIVTDGVTDSGGLYRSAAQDGLMTNYLFGSTSAFDLTQFNKNGGPNSDGSPAFPAGLATFKFSNLKIIGVPTFLTAGGSLEVALVSEGTITSGAPGGVFNLDSLDILALATVNGSITLGPELSFTSTRTFIPGPNSNPVLFVYARGATSDLVFGSNVNFADRRLELTAERNVQISSQITALSSTDPLTRLDPDVRIHAGNNFILDPTGKITASRVSIQAADVAGSGGALVDAVRLQIDTVNAASFTQSAGNLFVNTLPISQTRLQNLDVLGDTGLTVPGRLTSVT